MNPVTVGGKEIQEDLIGSVVFIPVNSCGATSRQILVDSTDFFSEVDYVLANAERHTVAAYEQQ